MTVFHNYHYSCKDNDWCGWLAAVTFQKLMLLYAFFWVIPQHLNFICRCFGTLFHLHRRVGTYLPMKMERTVCSETLAYKIQMPGNYPEESIQHSEHGKSLKSRTYVTFVSHPQKQIFQSYCSSWPRSVNDCCSAVTFRGVTCPI